MLSGMSVPFPECTRPIVDRRQVLLGYLDYFRATLLAKLDGLDGRELRSSRLPSGWTPAELLVHLVHVERRWIVWGSRGATSATRGATAGTTAGTPLPTCR